MLIIFVLFLFLFFKGFGTRIGRIPGPWKYPEVEECKRFMVNEWTDESINSFQIDALEGGGPNYGLLNPNDGRFSCFGIGTWNYATEVECRDDTEGWAVHTGEVMERKFAKMPSSIDCLKITSDMLTNTTGPEGTVFSKNIITDTGLYRKMCYKVERSVHGPVLRTCNATMEAAKANMERNVVTKIQEGRKVTYSISPNWGQFCELRWDSNGVFQTA